MEYVDRFIECLRAGQESETEQGSKARGTIAKEASILNRWKIHLKSTPLTAIRKPHVTRLLEPLRKGDKKLGRKGLSVPTVNLYVISLRLCLKKAVDDGYLKSLPTDGLKPLKVATKSRALVTAADIEMLCAAACQSRTDGSGEPVTKNGPQFADSIRLVAYCGGRYRKGLKHRLRDGHVAEGLRCHAAAAAGGARDRRSGADGPVRRRCTSPASESRRRSSAGVPKAARWLFARAPRPRR